MKFQVTKAKAHPLHGLVLTDALGRECYARSKAMFLDAGLVHFITADPAACPYRVTLPADPSVNREAMTVAGTDDPVALRLARADFEGALGIDPEGEWQEVKVHA